VKEIEAKRAAGQPLNPEFQSSAKP
jgi:hypothetical protein